ncbi:MAG: hypothetical protein ACI9ON_002352 [Limisphaerales bacterium]|jgi:hypothetical protein
MQSDKLIAWVQILTGLTVILGLGLVVWELQQSRSVARAELTSAGADLVAQKYLADLGENPARTYAKACEDPQSLSSEELSILDAAYEFTMVRAVRGYRIHQRTGLYEEWSALADASFRRIATIPGYVYWQRKRIGQPKAIQQRGDTVLNAAMESHPAGLACFQNGDRRNIDSFINQSG